jgi:uncharacterized protein (DUF362 family)
VLDGLASRRSFCAALGGLALLPACRGTPQLASAPLLADDEDPPAQLAVTSQGQGTSRVVEARWSAAVDGQGRVDPASASELLQAAMRELLGVDPYRAWAGAQRRIGIKVNAISCQAHVHPELAAALAGGLVAAGSDPSRVTVWDRDTFALRNRGYTISTDGAAPAAFRCLGSDALPAASTTCSVMIDGDKVWLSPLLDECDVLFSVAALKDHSMAGVSLTLKNNFGMLSGTAERLHGDYRHGSGCEPGISELAARPEVRDRLQLCVIDALVGIGQGGPGDAADPAHVFRRASILVSRDPVALDRRGLELVEARRRKLGLTPLASRTLPNPSPPLHIDNAAARGVSPG